MTEEEIIQSMRDGGKHLEEGAKVFYKGFCGPMCRFFVNQGASGSEAEDIFQETVIKAIDGAGTFSGIPGSGKPWLWAVARNSFNDYMRRKSRDNTLMSAQTPSNAAAIANLKQKQKDAREQAINSQTIKLEDALKITEFESVQIVTSQITAQESWGTTSHTIVGDEIDSIPDPAAEILPFKYETVDDCVDEGIRKFAKDQPERAYVLQLKMENVSIEEIAARIGRTAMATKSYLYECRGKLKPYVEECWEMVTA